MKTNLIMHKIEESLGKLTPSQRSLANYILINYDVVPMMSSVELASKVGVSDATVVRLCQKLGFTGYSEFKEELIKEQSKKEVQNPMDKMINTIKEIEEINSVVAQVFQNEFVNFKETVANFDVNSLEDIISCMIKARKIYIVGLNSCASLGHFIYFHLNRLGADVEMITSGGIVLYEKLAKVEKNDILITITFPRYSVESLNAIMLCKETGCKVIVLTDRKDNPLANKADYVLVAKSDNPLIFYNSFIGAMALCNVLILSYALNNQERSIEYLKRLKNLKKSKNLYI